MPEPGLHYELHGEPGEGPPWVLLVHGMLSSRAQWRPNIAALQPDYRLAVVELLGHGRSPAPAEPDAYTPATYMDRFEALREVLDAERWFVIGQSLGAALTLRYALDHPERIIAQAFTNSNSALAPPGWDDQVRPFLERQAEVFRREGREAIRTHRLNPAKAAWLSDEQRVAFEADIELHDPLGLALTGLHTTVGSSVYGRAGEIAVPTLLVVGEREERFRDACEYAARTIAGLEVVPADAGHAPNLADAETFNAAVLAFFARHAPA